jgi:hypothetical protein
LVLFHGYVFFTSLKKYAGVNAVANMVLLGHVVQEAIQKKRKKAPLVLPTFKITTGIMVKQCCLKKYILARFFCTPVDATGRNHQGENKKGWPNSFS